MISRIKLQGIPDSKPVAHKLQAGNLSMIFEDGCIRYICLGETEIIRMICFAVRDKEWLTVRPWITGEQITKSRHGFRITFDSRYRYNDIDFKAGFTLTVSSNALVAEMRGLALSTFLKNRIGFCVLHPVESCSGKKCLITHPDGTTTSGRFPQTISPHQVFRNIRVMQWQLNDAITASLTFDGEVFETEDQRNWTDASFKTYGTPLDLPYPVEVKRDTALCQRIEFSLDGLSHATIRPDENVIFRVTDEIRGRIPDIGIGSSSRPQPMSVHEAEIIRNIKFSHLRGEMHLFDERFEKQYATLSEESIKTELPAELCLLFGPEPKARFETFLRLYRRYPVPLKRIILLSQMDKTTPDSLISALVPVIHKVFPGIPTGAGTNCNFAQLNRSRPDSKVIDFISYAIHPQEHAVDNRSLMENTAGQSYTVQSVVQFNPCKPVCISPVTLQRRFNANIANYESTDTAAGMPCNTDSRQMSLFGAAWTVGSLKYLFESGASSITYFETVGERGIFMGDHESRWPMQFPAKKGMLFPVFQLFSILLQKTGYRVIRSFSTRPLLVDGFGMVTAGYGLVFLSNMTHQRQNVILEGITNYTMLFRMNAENFETVTRHKQKYEIGIFHPDSAISGPLSFRPYETLVLQYLME